MQCDGTAYEHLGGTHDDGHKKTNVDKRLLRRLETLGVHVTPVDAAGCVSFCF